MAARKLLCPHSKEDTIVFVTSFQPRTLALGLCLNDKGGKEREPGFVVDVFPSQIDPM